MCVITGVALGVTVVSIWPHALVQLFCHIQFYTWTGGAAGVVYTGTDPFHFPPAAAECQLLLFSLMLAFSSCRRKMAGIGSSICRPCFPSCPGVKTECDREAALKHGVRLRHLQPLTLRR